MPFFSDVDAPWGPESMKFPVNSLLASNPASRLADRRSDRPRSRVFAVAGILMGLFGADALAAHQLALNVASLTFMIPLGIGQAATVRVAFELGASAPRAAHLAGVVALLVGVS